MTASPSDLRRLRRLPYSVTAHAAPAPDLRLPSRAGFPAADSGYHTDQEWVDETAAIAAAHPSLVTRTQIGSSYENRPIWALKVSDHATADEAEPEVLFTHGQHAREHLTVEMAPYLLYELTQRYVTDARIRDAVDTREIWIVPSVNPGGAEFDVATGAASGGARTASPRPRPRRRWAPTSTAPGTFSGAAVAAGRAGIRPRRPTMARARSPRRRRRRCATSCGRAGSAACSRSRPRSTTRELVLWPYGYTYADTAPGLDAHRHAAFVAIGQRMAASNGYAAQQASDLYSTDGSIDDWLWGAEGVFALTFEMYPKTGDPGFYPPDEIIAAQTARNREAVLRLLEIADCPGAVASALTTRAGVRPDGRVRLRLRCRTTAMARCRGALTLRARLPGGAGRTATIARASFASAAGARTLTLRLRTAARRALRASTSRSRRVTLVRRR